MTFPKLFLLICASVAAVVAQPNAPSALQAVSATKSAVVLSWTNADPSAVSYRVERRALGDNSFTAIGSPLTAGYTDKSIDGMTAYVYRVRGVDAALLSSTASNEITVGPPPVGVTLVSPYRADLNFFDQSQFGIRPLMVLDANGDPAVVYSISSPNNINGDDTSKSSFLEFVGWDRANYKWKMPVMVGLLGNFTPSGGGANNYSFSRDASTNTWGVTTIVDPGDGGDTELRLYSSTDHGATWTATAAYSAYGIVNPSVALGGGRVNLSFYQPNTGIRYLTGSFSDGPDQWKVTTVPLPAGVDDYRQENHLGLDGSGQPGLAFWTIQGSYNSVLAFWRPGRENSTAMLDSNQLQNDYVEVKLAFKGTQAIAAAQVIRDDQGPSGYERYFWIATQSGDAFLAPVGLPSDGNSSLGYGSFAIGSAGQGALVSATVGGNSGGVQCGNPKLTLSADLVNWTTCSPYPSGNEPYTRFDWPQIAFAPNDGLYVAMYNGDAQSANLWGVILWRER